MTAVRDDPGRRPITSGVAEAMTQGTDAADGEPKPAHETTKARAPKTGAAERKAAEKESQPTKIRMTHLHAFLDENQRQRRWKAGDVITDPAEIELLTERKAPFQKLE
jgi:hypothetical protein